MSKKPLKPEDEALWRAITRDVTPLGDRPRADFKPVPKRPLPDQRLEPRFDPDMMPPPTAGSAAPAALTQLDGSRARRLQRGQLPVEGRIDLHGMTQDRAYRALMSFIPRAQAEGKRVVLVITGKGGAPKADPDNMFRDERTGVLRSLVPQWLTEGENAACVVAWHPAHKRHGGDGALYVVLRRLR
ncbi:MAG: Smr/MutS family protein [Alphaproteobacteria bacterium]